MQNSASEREHDNSQSRPGSRTNGAIKPIWGRACHRATPDTVKCDGSRPAARIDQVLAVAAGVSFCGASNVAQSLSPGGCGGGPAML
jgi:hypothetical protein